jgi:hypothetical protein
MLLCHRWAVFIQVSDLACLLLLGLSLISLEKNLNLGLSWTVPKSVEFSSTTTKNGEGLSRVISAVTSDLIILLAHYSRVTFDFFG